MRELSINGVSFNADYWATRTMEEFVKVNSQFWPGLGEQEKKNLLIRVWPYIMDNEPCRNDTSPGTPGYPDGH
jgi:hypothetical protein